MSSLNVIQTPMVNFTINGIPVSVPKGTTVYTACTQLGIDVPIFCYQDRMPPFGACRVCLVEVEKMPKPQTSCTLVATEGMVVKTQSQAAIEGREQIIEFLLINHPLDCPICDRGGECPLQEQALHHGDGESRFFEEKRHFKKPYSLGPVLMLDRERCIVCARCTRFGELVAGDHALEFIDRGYRTEVGTPDGGPADSKFIGNTIMICPVGALTSQVYRFRARPWDNEPTNSTCTLCPVGCSMIFDSRDGEIMRTRSLENHSLNDIWLCDKGWFGYEFVTNNERLNQPLIRKNNKLEPATWEEAITLIANKYQAAKNSGKVAGIGGHPLTVEENYLFQKLIRDGAGVGNVDYRVGMPIFSLEEEGIQPGMEIEIGDTANLQYAFLFGIDLTEEFPVIWLRLRHSINNGAKVIFAGHFAPEIEAYLAKTVLHNPGQEIEIIKQQFADLSSFKGKGAIFVGRQYLNSPNRKAILAELLKFKQSGANISLNLLEGKGNSTGSRFAGMHPEIGPDGATLAKPGLNINKVFETAAASGWDILHVAGANPAGKYPSKLWKQVREKLGFLIVQDIFLNETAAEADVVLPTLSYVEKGGHFITIEGRVQTLQPGKIVPDELYSDADIFAQIAGKLNVTLTIDNEFLQKLKPGILTFARPNTLNATATTAKTNGLLGTFTPALFDHGVRMKHDPKVLELSKPPKLRLHPVEANKYNLKNDDKLALTVNGNTIHGQVKIDDKVSQNTVVIPLGFEDVLPVHELGINLLNGIPVEVKKA